MKIKCYGCGEQVFYNKKTGHLPGCPVLWSEVQERITGGKNGRSKTEKNKGDI